MHSVSSETDLLERGWTSFQSEVALCARHQADVGLFIATWLAIWVLEGFLVNFCTIYNKHHV